LYRWFSGALRARGTNKGGEGSSTATTPLLFNHIQVRISATPGGILSGARKHALVWYLLIVLICFKYTSGSRRIGGLVGNQLPWLLLESWLLNPARPRITHFDHGSGQLPIAFDDSAESKRLLPRAAGFT
jgi:hypothetical protein